MHLKIFTICLVLLLASCGVGKKTAKTSQDPSTQNQPVEKREGKTYIGMASWYGKKFHGKRTASGEKFNMHKMTAAHKTLPFGTMLEVTNLSNNKSVTVRVNDRGPFIRGRILDLTYASAKQLGFIGQGHAKVKILVIEEKIGIRASHNLETTDP